MEYFDESPFYQATNQDEEEHKTLFLQEEYEEILPIHEYIEGCIQCRETLLM